jgi:hypothetical protein
LLPIGKFLGHLVYFAGIWYIFSRFGMLYQEKSGNPDAAIRMRLNRSYLFLRQRWLRSDQWLDHLLLDELFRHNFFFKRQTFLVKTKNHPAAARFSLDSFRGSAGSTERCFFQCRRRIKSRK